jgi:hypothetical protein
VPGDSALRGHQILGRVLTARQNSARTLYTEAATATNDLLWEGWVSDETKEQLGLILGDSTFAKIGITDTRQLWEAWGGQRDVLIDKYMAELGIEPGSEEEDETLTLLRDFFKIPADEEAWSTEWRGDEADLFAQRRREFPVLFNDAATAIAAGLGIDVFEGMTGEEFINELIAYRSLSEGAAWNAVRYNYTEYQETRGRAFSVAAQTLTDLTQNPGLDAAWRTELDDFVQWVGNMADRSYNEGDLTRSLQNEGVERFMRLATSGRDAPVNWDKLWRDGFQTQFGPLDWTPPTPKSPFGEEVVIGDDGFAVGESDELIDDAWMPHIRWVVDGDTLEVSRNLGPSFVDGPNRPEFGFEGEARTHKVRLLGVNAADYGIDADAARTAQERLEDALVAAYRNGDSIYLVRDPEYAGSHTDPFGRELAWLWIGDEPYYFPDELRRGD